MPIGTNIWDVVTQIKLENMSILLMSSENLHSVLFELKKEKHKSIFMAVHCALLMNDAQDDIFLSEA